MEILLLLFVTFIMGIVSIIKLIVAFASKKDKKASFILLGIFLILLIICFFIFHDSTKLTFTTENGIEELTINEFNQLKDENMHSWKNNYFNTDVIVSGKVTQILEGYTSTNLNHKFDAVIVIGDDIYVEVDKSNTILNTLKKGDTVEVKGKISTDLYDDVYMYGNNEISVK